MQVKVHDQYKDEQVREVTNPVMTDVVLSSFIGAQTYCWPKAEQLFKI